MLPQEALPPTGLWDKASHLLAYGALAVAGCAGFRGRRGAMRVGLGLLVLGMALELAQMAIPGRFASLADVAANAAGIVLGALLVAGVQSLVLRLRPSGP